MNTSEYKAQSFNQLPQHIEQLLEGSRGEKRKVVLATGVFDLFHQEHQQFLRQAKAAGDVLIVGLESDVRVKALKGEGRPLNSEAVRWQTIVNSGIADGVFVLPEVFHLPEHFKGFIHHVRPAVLAVSSHTAHLDRKSALLAEVGGEVQIVHEHNPQISTTILLEKNHQPA